MSRSYCELYSALGRIIEQKHLAEAEGDERSTDELKRAAGRIVQQMSEILAEDTCTRTNRPMTLTPECEPHG
jgi:hypothetical protein